MNPEIPEPPLTREGRKVERKRLRAVRGERSRLLKLNRKTKGGKDRKLTGKGKGGKSSAKGKRK